MKKGIALFLIVPIFFICFLLGKADTHADAAPTFYVTETSGAPGDTVAVNVCVKNNSGIVSLKLSISYDTAVLRLVSINEGNFAGVSYGALTAEPITINWVDAIHPNNATDGVIATLTFKILDNCELGDSAIQLSYNPNDVFDSDFDNVTFDILNGSVTVTDPTVVEVPCFKVVSMSGKRGDTVDVNIITVNNSGIVSFKLAVDYDRTALQLTDVCEKDFPGLSFGNTATTPLIVNWIDALNPNNTTNGIAVTLTFKIVDECELGKYAITVSYDPDDVYDSGFNNVSFDIINGEIEVLCAHKTTQLINQKEATEDSEGYTGDIFCKECNTVIESGTVTDKLPHTHEMIKTDALEPTCESGGNVEHYTCKKCGRIYADSNGDVEIFETQLSPNGHSYTPVVTAPTCTAQGYTTHTCHCGDSYVDSYTEKIAHSYGEWHEILAPTCTEKGTEQRDCNNCDHFETREVKANGHSYAPAVTAPTCTAQGYTTHTCHCGDSYVDSYTEKIAHSYGNWHETLAPTCTEKGTEQRDCGNCDHFETREVKANGHSHTPVVTAPTCTAQGYTTHTCHCGDSYVDSYTEKIAHSYGEWHETLAPTCTEKGTEQRDCNNCDYFETRELKANGHTYTPVVTAPTCTAQGYTTHTCHCGDSYVDSYTEKIAHSYGEWHEILAPTCTEKGTEQRDCANCDHFETREVKANGHSHTSTVVPPTASEGGYTEHVCDVCGHSYKDTFTDPLPYTLGDVMGDGEVNSDDAIYLLKHTLFPDMYPINQASDFDGSGELNSDDAIYLLKHTLFPDMYPLKDATAVVFALPPRFEMTSSSKSEDDDTTN